MKQLMILGLAFALLLTAQSAVAQEANEVELLRKQMQEMHRAFEEQQQLYQQQLQAMQKQVDRLVDGNKKETPPNSPPPTDTSSVISVDPFAAPTGASSAAPASSPDFKSWRPTDPIRLRSGNAQLDIGLTGTFVAGGSTTSEIGELNPGGHDPSGRGFSVQGIEASFLGSIDPYFQGSANLNFALAADGETFVEVEEAWLESMSLPWNFQVRAGQMYSDFGRHNSQHVHAWSFVDQPLAVSRLLGADGMRNPGARASWLAPMPWFTEFSFTLQNSGGGTASSFRGSGHSHGDEEEEELPFGFRHQDNDRGVRSFGDMLFNPRLATSFNITDTHTLLLGGSAAFGPNNSGGGGETDTRIYGADLTWKWQSRNHDRGFPFVSLQSEFLARNYELGSFDWDEDGNGGDGDGDTFVDEGILTDPVTGLPAIVAPETVSDYGLYSQFLYGFKPGWVAGLRFDYLFGDRANYEVRGLGLADGAGGIDAVGLDLERGNRYRISPNLTYYPSEFSKIRLQYNYDDRDQIGIDHSLWLQFEMSLGAHSAHRF
ncbi:hypothetical protein N9059_01100 [bacterium]|nr:hypothetical protein [bacterium]